MRQDNRFFFLLAVFCASSLLVRAGAFEPKVVGDRAVLTVSTFADQQDIDRWTLRAQGTKAYIKPSVKKGAEVLFPTCQVWPAIYLTEKNFDHPTLRYYDYITADIDNFKDTRLYLNIEIRRTCNGFRDQWRNGFNLGPGPNQTLRVKLTHDMQITRIHEFFIFQAKPSRDVHFTISNLRFETFKLPRKRQELAAKRDALLAPMALPANASAALKEDYAQLLKDWKAFKAEVPADNFQDLFKQFDRFYALEKGIADWGSKVSPLRFAAVAKNGLAWGWVNGIDRVYRDKSPFPGSFGVKEQVALAKGEVESAQLCLFSTERMTITRFAASDFRSAEGAVLSAKDISIAPLGYVDIKKMRYYAERIGWTPDPVLDYLKTMPLEPGKVQPLWLDINAPEDQKAGVYEGTISLKNDKGQTWDVPLSIKVYDFKIPYRNTFPTAIASRFDDTYYNHFYGDGTKETFREFVDWQWGLKELDQLSPGARRLYDVMRKFEKSIWAHRIPVDHIYRMRPIRVDELKRTLNGRNSIVCLFAAEKKNTGEQLVEWMDKLAPTIIENGWQDRVYVYGFDEIRPDQFQRAVSVFRPLRKKYPWLNIMTTAFDYSLGRETGMNEVMNIWVPQIRTYFEFPEENRMARSLGHKVWYYVCCYPSPPVANWLLESDPTATRLLMGIMPYKFKVEGFLHWAILRWKANRKVMEKGKEVVRELVWKKPLTDGPMTSHDGKGFYEFNGDGFLFYPGKDGPVASVRAKLVRDGLEDYEYCHLLEQALKDAESGKLAQSADWQAAARACLAIEDAVVEDSHLYTRQGSVVLKKRAQMASLLEQVKR